MSNLQGLPQIITAIGGLGTAAFGLVDASKVLWGGVNHIGFNGVKTTVEALTPGKPGNSLSQKKILATLQANWFNGTDLGSQKSIAKSLIKLHLDASIAPDLAAVTGVNSEVLTAVATSITSGTPLSPAQSDVYARFDLSVTALLDEAYQRSDQVYRNWTRAIAAVVAILLALAGGHILQASGGPSPSTGACLLVGLLATPLAPIAKDLSTALAAAVNTLQLVRK
ncbi:MAG: hypothetical protein ABSD96_19910 [Candidatus Korobacteraceae bacterium]|jgi:hypothetical protein